MSAKNNRVMKIEPGKRFWVTVTVVVVLFTGFVVARNLVHAFKIKRQVNALERDREIYLEKIRQDSTLIERLRYDDYLEEYARMNFRMQRRDEQIYIMED